MKLIISSSGNCRELYEYFLEEILGIPFYEGILITTLRKSKIITKDSLKRTNLFLFVSEVPKYKSINTFFISQKKELLSKLKGKITVPGCMNIETIKKLNITNFELLDESFLFYKTENEKNKIHNSYKEAETLILEIYKYLKSNSATLISEQEISMFIKNYLINKNLFWSFEPIVAFNKNTSNIHHTPSDKKQKPELIMLDMGVIKDKYCSDITVMFVKQNNKKMIEQIKIIESIKNNIHLHISQNISFLSYKNIDDFSQKQFIQNNLKKEMYSNFHALSHSIGRRVHEKLPDKILLSKKQKRYSYFTIEPAMYTKEFGIRLEDTIEIDHEKRTAKRLNLIPSFFILP